MRELPARPLPAGALLLSVLGGGLAKMRRLPRGKGHGADGASGESRGGIALTSKAETTPPAAAAAAAAASGGGGGDGSTGDAAATMRSWSAEEHCSVGIEVVVLSVDSLALVSSDVIWVGSAGIESPAPPLSSSKGAGKD